MSESEYVLAIDAGTHRLTAVTACAAPSGEIDVASFAVGGGRDSIAVLAVVTADGELLFGDEAAETAALHPERALRDVVARIGDDVPLVASGYSVLPEQVLARLILWVTAAVAAQRGSQPAAITLAHPADWHRHRTGLVQQALHELGLEVVMLASPLAAAHEHVDAATGTPRGLRAVFDLGGSTCTATIVRAGSSGVRQIGAPVVIGQTGGGGFDDALLAHALAMTGIDALGAASSAQGLATLVAARDSAIAAKEALSFDGDAEMRLSAGDRPTQVRITRSEFESMIAVDLDRAVDALDQVLEQTELAPEDLTEVLLVGGSSGIPLVVQRLSARFDVALVAASDPQLTIARGAARRAWATLAAATPSLPVGTAAEPEEEEPQRRQGVLSAFRGRAARVATPAASAAALTVAAVLVGGGIILGTTAPAGDRSDAAEADEPLAAGLAGNPFSDARHGSDFSVAGGVGTDTGADETLSDALVGGISDAFGLDDSAVGVSEPRPRTPQAPGDPSAPPTAEKPKTDKPKPGGSGGGSASTPAPSGGSGSSGASPSDPPPADSTPLDPPSDPAPSDPAPSDPAPSDPAPSDPAPSDPAPSDPPPTDPDPAAPAPTDPSSSPVDPQPPESDPSPSAAADPTPPPTDPSPPPAP